MCYKKVFEDSLITKKLFMTVYKEAGVNILSTDNLIREITPLCSKTKRPGKIGKNW